MGATQELARFATETTYQNIPDAIIHEGKRCVINFVSVALNAARDPSLGILLDMFREEGGRPHASVLGEDFHTTLQNAAMANGYLAHFDDYDDTHFPTVAHPSAPTIPAALALAEHHSETGREFLTACILGIEACCRVSLAIHPWHYDAGWHITGTAGVFGAAVAAGRTLGLKTDHMIAALGIAGTQAAGVREVFGSMTKPLHPGRAAQAGVMAGLLAARGFTSTSVILEGRRGFASVLSAKSDLSQISTDLGTRWELPKNGLKPYACGVVSHPLIDAMIRLRTIPGVSPKTVSKIEARVHPLVLDLVNNRDPKTGLEGKFSFRHSMAAALVDGAGFPQQYTDARVKDPEIARLRGLVTATADKTLGEDQADVTVTLSGGQTHHARIEHATGSPDNPMTDVQLEAKFHALVDPPLSEARATQLLDRLWHFDSVKDIREIVRLCRFRRGTPQA